VGLYITRTIQGFSLGSFAPVAFAYTFELFPPERRTFILALINTVFLVAGMLGQVIGGFIEEAFNWRYVFLFFSIVYILLFLFSWRILPHPPAKPAVQHNILKTFFIHLTSRQLIKCYMIMFTLLLSFVSFYESLSAYFEAQPNVEENQLL
jgi:MFS transporter, YNFM family, putative membrane transport protein